MIDQGEADDKIVAVLENDNVWGEAREIDDLYEYPGAIQYFGPPSVSQAPPRTLLLERTGSQELPGWLRES